MKTRFFLISILIIALIPIGSANESLSNKQIEKQLREAFSFMQTLQRVGGWAMSWSSDLKLTMGEHSPRPADCVTIQYPATPGTASIFLRAYQVLGDKQYLQSAKAAGDYLAANQLDHGGFPHEYYNGKPRSHCGTFDDDSTQSALRFLVELWQETQNETYKQAAQRCAQFMLDAQYENGGWPQAYPLREGHYSSYITLNDDAMMDVIRAMLICYHAFDDKRYYNAAIQGADCLLALQGKEPQGGWAQQYTPDGRPAPARRFEPTALTTHESVGALQLLLEVYRETGDKKYLKAGKRAFDWMKKSRLPNGLWARFYEYGTNQDLYCTPDGKIITHVKNARPGYGWQGNYYSKSLAKKYKQLLQAPANKRKDMFKKQISVSTLKKRALSALQDLDRRGRWLEPMGSRIRGEYKERHGNPQGIKLIHSGTFCANAKQILAYLGKK